MYVAALNEIVYLIFDWRNLWLRLNPEGFFPSFSESAFVDRAQLCASQSHVGMVPNSLILTYLLYE